METFEHIHLLKKSNLFGATKTESGGRFQNGARSQYLSFFEGVTSFGAQFSRLANESFESVDQDSVHAVTHKREILTEKGE